MIVQLDTAELDDLLRRDAMPSFCLLWCAASKARVIISRGQAMFRGNFALAESTPHSEANGQDCAMGNDITKLEKANTYATRVETWWSLIEKLWENRTVISVALAAAGVLASAIYKVFGLINDMGWPGWVLALLPAMLIVGGLLGFADWLFHLRRMRKLRETNLATPAEYLSTPVQNELVSSQQDVDRLHQKVDAIKIALHSVTEETAFLPALRNTLSEQFKGVEARMSALNERMDEISKISEHFVSKMQSEIGKQVEDDIKRLNAALEMKDSFHSMSRIDAGQRERSSTISVVPEKIKRNLCALGISVDRINEAIATVEAKIIGDAKYLHLKEGEPWQNEEAKRRWHIQVASVEAYKSLLRDTRLTTPRDDVFLAQSAGTFQINAGVDWHDRPF